MRFPADTPVRPAKLDELRARIAALDLDLSQVEESFIKTGGPGGQKVNKTECGVQLRYPPEDLVITCRRERSRALNRFLALRQLVETLERRADPDASAAASQVEKIRKQKARRRRRAKGMSEGPASEASSGE